MKQRHRKVTNVVGRDLESLDQCRTGEEDRQMHYLHRFRLTAGPDVKIIMKVSVGATSRWG
ncbi:hypothetical protein I552_1021 [Mycobacterium xenopi 3993]|nr:hypothetical protein I552_1021 [Mycobacterium xenopi 3993]